MNIAILNIPESNNKIIKSLKEIYIPALGNLKNSMNSQSGHEELLLYRVKGVRQSGHTTACLELLEHNPNALMIVSNFTDIKLIIDDYIAYLLKTSNRNLGDKEMIDLESRIIKIKDLEKWSIESIDKTTDTAKVEVNSFIFDESSITSSLLPDAYIRIRDAIEPKPIVVCIG